MAHWVDKFLVPLKVCDPAILKKARRYPDPQSAWDDWDDGWQLLWNLRACGEEDRQKLVLCACDIAERILPLFETRYPEDDRPRKAIKAARRWADNPTEENKDAADAAAYAAARAAESKEQAGIVRKYFPISPFMKQECEVQHD